MPLKLGPRSVLFRELNLQVYEAWFVGGRETLFSRSEVDVLFGKGGEAEKFKTKQFY
jgi:hypothetical protein